MKLLDAVSILAIVAVIAIFIFFAMQPKAAPADYDVFAKCLTEKGAKMYGSELCTHCQEQKESFGESWQYVTYVECHSQMGSQTQACTDAGIKAYPTWEFADKSRTVGTMEFDQLSEATGCALDNKAG